MEGEDDVEAMGLGTVSAAPAELTVDWVRKAVRNGVCLLDLKMLEGESVEALRHGEDRGAWC